MASIPGRGQRTGGVRTSTEYAVWTPVEGGDKPYTRIKVLRTLSDTFKTALRGSRMRRKPGKARINYLFDQQVVVGFQSSAVALHER